tara:strand:+ start:674 stop:919 length:246 start_codon:yes stop_codon:yes gene_type:complete
MSDCNGTTCSAEDCVNQAAAYMCQFGTVDNDLYINKIANGYLVKIDGQDHNDNWISRQFAMPTIACVEQTFVAWAEYKRDN